MSATLYIGDCRAVMAGLDPESFDSIVCDPPYGIGFMGKDWDTSAGHKAFQLWAESWAIEAYRVLKPGGYLLAFGGTRTFHRLTSGIEDAGFEIRDCLMWLYGSGFPKSLDVSKAIDKDAGAEREIVGPMQFASRRTNENTGMYGQTLANPRGIATAPATADAVKWNGYGTALKPSWEPIILARKLIAGTVAANVLAYGTGALNIDVCRIETEDLEGLQKNWNRTQSQSAEGGRNAMNGGLKAIDLSDRAPNGRWPANLILDELAAEILDEQSGELTSGGTPPSRSAFGGLTTGTFNAHEPTSGIGRNSGGASRFFYTAKASRSEREIGMFGVDPLPLNWSSGDANPGSFQAEGTNRTAANNHPTVKPVDLMQWLCRLVTQPGGRILDPFLGSGSTGIAAAREGFAFVGIDQSADYVAISRRRITGDAPLFNTVEVIDNGCQK